MTNTPISTGRQILNVALYYVMFFFVQVVVMAIAYVVYAVASGQSLSSMASLHNANLMVGVTLLYSFLTVALFVWRRWAPFSRTYMQTRPWAVLVWAALLAVGSNPLCGWLNGLTGMQVPPSTTQMLTTLINHPLGWLTVGVAVPVAEEVVFRGAILRALLTLFGYRWRWAAIGFTALLFGVAHGNMAQMANAVLMGMLLGWLYMRSGSIAPGIVFHMVNNSMAVVMVRLMPGLADSDWSDLFAGDPVRLALFLLCALCVFLPSLWQLSRRM